MPRHLLQHLIGAAALVLLGLGACVDEPAPAAHGSKVVLPNLSGPGRRPARRLSAARRRAATLPATLGRGTVGAAWVEQRLASPSLTILDLRPARNFRRGHLPGAVNDPAGRTLLAAALARLRTAATGKPPTLPSDPPGRTVVLVHGGQDLAERAAAARAYLALYATGATPGRLAILRGGYASWRRQRRPRSTASADRPRPRPRPVTHPGVQPRSTPAPPTMAVAVAKPGKPRTIPRLRRQVLLTDPATLATARNQPRTLLVHTGLHRPALRTGRPKPAWLRFGVAPLQPAPGALPHSATELRQLLGPLLATRAKVRLIAFSKKGLWASLLWFTLKTRLNRPDALNAVYLVPALGGFPPR